MALDNQSGKKTKKTAARKATRPTEKAVAKKPARRKTKAGTEVVEPVASQTGPSATAVMTEEGDSASFREARKSAAARRKKPAATTAKKGGSSKAVEAKPAPEAAPAARSATKGGRKPAEDAEIPLVWDDEEEPHTVIVVPPRAAQPPREVKPVPAPPRIEARPAPRSAAPVDSVWAEEGDRRDTRVAPRPRNDTPPAPPRAERPQPAPRPVAPPPPPAPLDGPVGAREGRGQDEEQEGVRRGRRRRRRRGRGRGGAEPVNETPDAAVGDEIETLDGPEVDIDVDSDVDSDVALLDREVPAEPLPLADRGAVGPREDREEGGRRGRRGKRRRGRRKGEPEGDREAGVDGAAEAPIEVDGFEEDDVIELAPREIRDPMDDDDDLMEARGKVVDVEDRDWEDHGEDEERPEKVGTREMLINVSAGDEVRIAVLESGKLEELFIEREGTQSMVGNIYKGRITNVEPSIQAVFVDFGTIKNGFLHISDVQPQYFGKRGAAPEDVGRKIPRHARPPIQECFRRGQEVIVQITKDGLGTKGPTLTTYLSIPGRFLVMMPGMNKLGVSRKIEDEDERRKMREVLDQLELPSGFGFILRTAGMGRNRRELQRDLNYLMRLWRTVAERVKREPSPAELYRESDLVTRTIRDVYTHEFRRLIVDDPTSAEKAKQFLHIVMPRVQSPVELYTDREPLFHRYGIEAEIEKINMRHVPLPSGGSIVIDSTEAMVAIDVNSGKFRTPDDPEQTALKINVEAAEEIARQLRLRDLGGLIVCDFIDMRFDRNRKTVEKALRDALKKHKERARVLRMSAFGLIEITRQRSGPSIKRNTYLDCAHCKGTGLVKMPESVMLDVMRAVQLATHREDVQRVLVGVSTEVAWQILNSKRALLSQIEQETGKQVVVRGEAGFTPDEVNVRCEDAQGRISRFAAGLGSEAAPAGRRR